MGYKELQEVDNIHPVTHQIMGTRAHDLFKLDRDTFADRFKTVPDKVQNADNYRQEFIDQIKDASQYVFYDEDDDIESKFEEALKLFYDYIEDDYDSLPRDLRLISIANLSMKDLYDGYLDALGNDGLNNDQLWQIYKTLPNVAKRTFFKSTKYQKGQLLHFKDTKSQKDLIHYLRKNEKLKIQLTPHQVKYVLKKLELGDLINLDKITATTQTKATDFWTNMSVTTYRWSGTVAETVTLARYLPFLSALSKSFIAPIVIAISGIVAVHHHQKFLNKEARRNKKFISRCLSKNAKKQALQDAKEDALRIDDFKGRHAYQILRHWIKRAGLKDDFKKTLREANKAYIPRQKHHVLKTALANKRDKLSEIIDETDQEAFYRSRLYHFISETAPEEDYSEDSETEEDIPKKRLAVFNKEVPWELQLFLETIVDFLTPFWMLLKEIFGPIFSQVKEFCAPYAMPFVYGLVSALGIIALTCAYTLALEVVLPVSILAVLIGGLTGAARYIRDRKLDMDKAILDGQVNKERNMGHQIEDWQEYQNDCEVIHEIRNEKLLKPAKQSQNTDDSSEETEVEIHVRKGDKDKVIKLDKAALQGLKRNTALNFAQQSDSEESYSSEITHSG